MLNPPFLPKFSRASRSPAVTKGGTIYYPLWLAYATGVLEQAGHEVKLIDAPAEGHDKEKVMKIAKKFSPQLIVSDTATASIYNDVEFAAQLKKETSAFVVLVGTHVSALPSESLKINPAIDAIARREYDYTLRELAEELEKINKKGKKQKVNLKKIKGLSFRKSKKIIHNKERPFIDKLDELPFVSAVYKKHLNYKNYFYAANLYPEITIVTGRGCPNMCTFCVLPQVMNGRAYRQRSIENVIAEFKYIRQNFPDVKEIFIEDDTFTANRYRAREFCDALLKNNIKITWSCNARADVDFETLQKMKKAGCRLLCVGFESGAQEILNNIRKGMRIETIKKFMQDAKKAGLLVHGCFMLGNQGETKETIAKTVEFAKLLNPDTAQFFPIMVYPGTETYSWAKRNGHLTSEDFAKWLDANGQHNCIISRPELTNKALVELCDRARMEFYLRPNYIASKFAQAITDPKEIPRLMKAGKIFSRHLLKFK